jgi:hypothetical protein
MKKHIALFTLVTAALITAPVAVRAEDKAPAATETKPAKQKNADATPFHAKVTAVDAAGSTITLGELKLNVTAETKISKDGKTATLADFAAGDDAHGSYKTDADGKKNALSLRTGQKAPKAPKKKKADAAN